MHFDEIVRQILYELNNGILRSYLPKVSFLANVFTEYAAFVMFDKCGFVPSFHGLQESTCTGHFPTL